MGVLMLFVRGRCLEFSIITSQASAYHGSFTIISSPDLSKCMPGRGFGKGFYVTATSEQAERLVKNSVGKAMKNGIIQGNQGFGYVSVFRYEPMPDLRII